MGPSAYVASKVKELDYIFTINTDGYKSTAFYLHKTTNEPYIVVATLEHYGGGYISAYHSMTKVTSSDIDVILAYKAEYDYATAYQSRDYIFEFKKMGRSFLIDGQQYRYMVYLRINNVDISAQGVLLNENEVRIPTTHLPTKQYEQYHVCPGPYEHYYDVPVNFIDKVHIRIDRG